MNIAWHMPTLSMHTCGLSMRAIEFAARLQGWGNRVTLFVDAAKTDVAGECIRGMELVKMDIPFARSVHWSLQAVARRKRSAVAANLVGEEWDLVISCQPEFVATYGARTRRPPLVYVCGSTTLHHDEADVAAQSSFSFSKRLPFTIDRTLKRTNERRAFLAAEAAVFDSDQTRDLVIHAYNVSPTICHTVRGGVDTNRFLPATPEEKVACRYRLGIAENARVVTWTGRMSPEKNLPLLLGATARMRDGKTLVLLVGDGPERTKLERQVASLGLKDRVRFVGACGDVRQYLRAADVFAFPSRSESFGCSLAEALACGLPVVALRPDGVTIRNASIEVVEEGDCGLLADEPSVEAFATQLTHLCDDAALRAKLGRAARLWAQRYDWDAGASQVRTLIESLLPAAAAFGEPKCLSCRSAEPVEPVVG